MSTEKELVRFQLEDGGSVLFETDARYGGAVSGPQLIARGSGAPEATPAEEKFETVIARIRPAAQQVLDALRGLNTPKEIQLEFGLKFSAKAGVVIASADSEASFKVSVKWVNKE